MKTPLLRIVGLLCAASAAAGFGVRAHGGDRAESGPRVADGWLASERQTAPAVAASFDERTPAIPPPPTGEVELVPPDESRRLDPPLFEDPYDIESELPPLAEELCVHGGSYLYAAEGDRLNWPGADDDAHFDLLRLPEQWQKPLPLTGHREFLGADPIVLDPAWRWFGRNGYVWEPLFVGSGSYEAFGLARAENDRRQDLVGHQLTLDLDLRLTGTERFHVQYRPIGREGTGGSYYQFSNPSRYIDNSTGEPDRYWVEAELHSLVGPVWDPFAALDYNLTAGRIPLSLHNQLLINDELLGVIVNKNSLLFDQLSNVNLQAIYGASDVSTAPGADPQLFAVHAAVDHRRVFYEATYAYLQHDRDSGRDAHYAAASRTALIGTATLAVRGFAKWGDSGGRGSGQLVVVESQRVRVWENPICGVEKGVFYCNALLATQGWNSIARANFNRLSLSLEVDPLIRIAATPSDTKTWAVAAGVQLFRHHEDESLVPEIAYEDRGGTLAVGVSLRWLRKTSARTYFEVTGTITESSDPARDREGVGAVHTVLF